MRDIYEPRIAFYDNVIDMRHAQLMPNVKLPPQPMQLHAVDFSRSSLVESHCDRTWTSLYMLKPCVFSSSRIDSTANSHTATVSSCAGLYAAGIATPALASVQTACILVQCSCRLHSYYSELASYENGISELASYE